MVGRVEMAVKEQMDGPEGRRFWRMPESANVRRVCWYLAMRDGESVTRDDAGWLVVVVLVVVVGATLI